MKNNFFTVSIVLCVVIAYYFPEYFITIGDYKLSNLIVPLLQIIMFGMGTTISFQDFVGVIKMPKAVLIGLSLQFLIMPFWGFGITKIFDFPPEIAAGIVLVGASPSGLASNVMSLIAKANIPLSITITTCATFIAPVLTPLFMRWLGGSYIEVDFWGMVWSMAQLVLIPVLLGFVVRRIAGKQIENLNKMLPFVSMLGIALIILIITAAGQSALKSVGLLLLVAVVMHNLGGYVFGYGTAKLLKMSKQDCRTIALEVGLQNGGLASGLASQMGKMATVGLAPALFGPMMNISGSILAGIWGRKPLNTK